MSKRCTTCGDVQSYDEFNKNPQMTDGHVNQCKSCKRLADEARYEYQQSFNIAKLLQAVGWSGVRVEADG